MPNSGAPAAAATVDAELAAAEPGAEPGEPGAEPGEPDEPEPGEPEPGEPEPEPDPDPEPGGRTASCAADVFAKLLSSANRSSAFVARKFFVS